MACEVGPDRGTSPFSGSCGTSRMSGITVGGRSECHYSSHSTVSLPWTGCQLQSDTR